MQSTSAFASKSDFTVLLCPSCAALYSEVHWPCKRNTRLITDIIAIQYKTLCSERSLLILTNFSPQSFPATWYTLANYCNLHCRKFHWSHVETDQYKCVYRSHLSTISDDIINSE